MKDEVIGSRQINEDFALVVLQLGLKINDSKKLNEQSMQLLLGILNDKEADISLEKRYALANKLYCKIAEIDRPI